MSLATISFPLTLEGVLVKSYKRVYYKWDFDQNPKVVVKVIYTFINFQKWYIFIKGTNTELIQPLTQVICVDKHHI